MRTVTFADERVVDFLNERFVVVWNNHSPLMTATGEQPIFSPAEMEAYPEGGGAGNLRSYFAAPDGQLVADVQGYWSPDLFLKEATFAAALAPQHHGEHRQALEADAEKLAAAHPEELNKPIRESRVRRRIAALAILAQWHESGRYEAMAMHGQLSIVTQLELARTESARRGVIS